MDPYRIIMPSGALPVLNLLPGFCAVERHSSLQKTNDDDDAPTSGLVKTFKEKLQEMFGEDVTNLIETQHDRLVKMPEDVKKKRDPDMDYDDEDDENDEYTDDEDSSENEGEEIVNVKVCVNGMDIHNDFDEDTGAPNYGGEIKCTFFLKNTNYTLFMVAISLEDQKLLIYIDGIEMASVIEKIDEDTSNSEEDRNRISSLLWRDDKDDDGYDDYNDNNNNSILVECHFDDNGPTYNQALWFVAKYIYAHFGLAFLRIQKALAKEIQERPEGYSVNIYGSKHMREFLIGTYKQFKDFLRAVQDEKRKQLKAQFPDKTESQIEQMIPNFGV
jgi:hypothetical protein